MGEHAAMTDDHAAQDTAALASDFDIPGELLADWQDIVNLVAQLMEIPAALIMRVAGEDLEVFVASASDGNPYAPGDRKRLHGSGLYCEAVINSEERLIIPNALKDDAWKDNPDIKLGMISYMGFPILAPDGDCFGTICVLDAKENAYSETYAALLDRFRGLIQRQLETLMVNQILGEANQGLLALIEEIQVLRGIVPICAHCKRIRDDKGYWNAVESYIATHSEAQFSHSICPPCLEKHYPEYAQSVQESMATKQDGPQKQS